MKTPNQYYWLLVCGLCLAGWCQAEVYKTTDKDGNVIYSDSPGPGEAKKLELRELNTLPSPPPVPSPGAPQPDQPELPSYEVTILSPRDQVIIPVGQRDLPIAVSLNQPLQAEHLLVYFLNDELLEETRMSNILVKDVARGIHSVRVEVIDANGQSLGMSAPVTVNLMRPVRPKPASPGGTVKPPKAKN